MYSVYARASAVLAMRPNEGERLVAIESIRAIRLLSLAVYIGGHELHGVVLLPQGN